MKKKSMLKILLFILAGFILMIAGFCFQQYHVISKICFYNYDLSDIHSVYEDFKDLGFSLKGRKPEKMYRRYLFFEDVGIDFESTEDKSYVILICQEKKMQHFFEKKFSSHYTCEIKENNFPKHYRLMSNVLCYTYTDRKIYLGEYSSANCLLIEFDK